MSGIKDSLLQKVDKKETDVNTFITKDVNNFSMDYKNQQYERNRNNVCNIHK